MYLIAWLIIKVIKYFYFLFFLIFRRLSGDDNRWFSSNVDFSDCKVWYSKLVSHGLIVKSDIPKYESYIVIITLIFQNMSEIGYWWHVPRKWIGGIGVVWL